MHLRDCGRPQKFHRAPSACFIADFLTAEFRVQRWILHAIRYHDNEHSVSHIAILYFNLM